MKVLKRSPKTPSHGRVMGGIKEEIKGREKKQWGDGEEKEKKRCVLIEVFRTFQTYMTGTT